MDCLAHAAQAATGSRWSLFDLVGSGVAVTAADGAIEYCNSALLRLLAQNAQTLCGTSIFALLDGGANGALESLHRAALAANRELRTQVRSSGGKFVAGAVLRRSTYLQLPGFEPRFFHMYEEPDYALQCVAAGYDVLFSPILTIRHHYSGQTRDEVRVHHRHARNEFWSTLMRCPFPFAIGMVAWRVFSQFFYACKRGWSWVIREPLWWGQALTGIPYCLRKRRPVSWAGYKRWLALP